MKVSTAVNHLSRVRSSLADLVRMARRFGMTQNAMLMERSRILATVEHCPRWVTKSALEYYRGMMDVVSESHVYLYHTRSHGLRGVKNTESNYYGHVIGVRELQSQVVAKQSGWYWPATDKRGPKPFFLGSDKT